MTPAQEEALEGLPRIDCPNCGAQWPWGPFEQCPWCWTPPSLVAASMARVGLTRWRVERRLPIEHDEDEQDWDDELEEDELDR